MLAMVRAMGRQRQSARGQGDRATPQSRERAERETRLAIYRLQDAAYANLRSAVANVAIFIGFVGAFMLIIGAAGGARMIPTIVCVIAGLVGIGYYLARPRPRTALYVLLAASLLVAVGIVGLVVAAQASDV